MVTKCANPLCANQFHYLRDGRLFIVEVEEGAGLPVPGPHLAGKKARRIEHYWLCDECAPTLTLAVDRQRGVVAVPVGTPVARRAAAS